jgi:flagellin
MTEKKVRDSVAEILGKENVKKGVKVTTDQTNAVKIELNIVVEFGTSIAALGNSIIQTVRYNVEKMTGLTVKDINVVDKTGVGAKTAIETIKEAINIVSGVRGTFGAMQNRLEYTINNLDTTAENMTAANSRIRDTDMAKEMMNYTKMNVLTQAAQAMLAQANQQPQAVLQLLQ